MNRECYYCEEQFNDEDGIYLSIDFGNESEDVDRDCMFEYIFENFVWNGSAEEFMKVMTDGYNRYKEAHKGV